MASKRVVHNPNFTSKSSGSSFVGPVRDITFAEWVQPLVDDFINYRTKDYREKYINKDAHVVVLSERVLTSLDENGQKVLEDGIEGHQVRTYAKEWIARRRPNQMKSQLAKDIHSLNVTNAARGTFHYVVFRNFSDSQKLFKELKDKGFMRKGYGTQRGHETAAVRMQADSALGRLKGTASGGDLGGEANRQKNVAHAAAKRLTAELQAASDRLTPTLKWNSKMHIDSETRGIDGVDHLVILTPETRASNQGSKQALERKHRDNIERIVRDFVKQYGNLRLNITGSKSPLKEINEQVTDMLLGKRRKAYKTRQSKTIKVKKKKVPRASVKVSSPPKLRTKGGQFTSAMNIQAILDQRIKQQVQDNMGEGGALVNRTGRFAQSVSVEKVMQSRQGVLTAFYTYMKAPYQTFERGYAQGSLRRDPRKLINRSIREIAMETLNHKLPIRTRRV